MRFILQSFLLLLNSLLSKQSELHLELVQVIMRHGERTPVSTEMYPTDPYNTYQYPDGTSTYEPWGIGQLTNKGKMTEYRIGTMLRERYDNFLGSIYHPQDIYAVSTDFDRTKMSLQLMLAGLYPANLTQIWNPQLRWLAIPTHYVPMKVDTMLLSTLCSEYKAALEEVQKTEQVRNKIAVYQDFYETLSNYTGLTIVEPNTVYEVYNTLTAQKSMNLTVPTWCTDEVYNKMKDVVDLLYKIRSYTTDLKRLNGGMLIKKFIDNMGVTNEHRLTRKMYIYSGHEINIAAFAKAHNIDKPKLPEYGSTFMFEKLKNETGNYFIRIALWTGTTEKLIPITLNGCAEICPLETYLQLVQDVIPSDEEATCLSNNVTKRELLELFAERMSD